MRVCCCTLAGTRACWTCPNNGDYGWNTPRYEYWWTVPDYTPPTIENWKEAIDRLTQKKTTGTRTIEKFDDKGNLIERIVEAI